MKPKLAVIVSHPIQHFSPVYRTLADHSQLNPIVFYFSDVGASSFFDKGFMKSFSWDIDLLNGYRHTILEHGKSVNKGFWEIYSKRIWEELSHENPDAVLLYGYSQGIQWQVLQWAKKYNKKILYFSDSELIRQRSMWSKILKYPIIYYFFSSVNIFLTTGDNNEAYLKFYGADEKKFHRCPLSVDIKRLRAKAMNSAAIRNDVRKKYGITPHDFVVLFTGKLMDIKRPMDLLKAVLNLKNNRHRVVALFVGSGILSDSLKEFTQCNFLQNNIHFAGFVNQSEIAHYYLAADVLAITSETDAHPLVATEAAALGLSLIVSDRVGCIGKTDVAQPNHNALVYPCGDIDKLSYAIQQLKDSPKKRQIMSEKSKVIAETQDISVAASAIENAVLSLCR